jgi:hypothetical protein
MAAYATILSRDEDTEFAGTPAILAAICRFFDIVNGFFNRCRGAWRAIDVIAQDALLQMCNLAEIIVRTDAAG